MKLRLKLRAAAAAAVFAGFAAMSGCSSRLASGGKLAAALPQSDGVLLAAAEARGVELDARLGPEYWLGRYQADRAAGVHADLYAADWGRELFGVAPAADPELAKVWKRTAAAAAAPAWVNGLDVGPTCGFVPATAYAWGLFFHSTRLAELGGRAPADLAGFEALLAKAKAAGITPIALGSAFGWPGAAWFALLDLRLNGAAQLAGRYAGTRPWNDAGGLAVAAKLAAWRDAGYFTPTAAGLGLSDALRELESGQALCTLMGAFAVDRFASPARMLFAAFPAGQAAPAELVGLSGFFLPPAPAASADAAPTPAAAKAAAKAANRRRETAYDLVDAYLANGGGGDAYRLPLALLYKAIEPREVSPHLTGLQQAEADLLVKAAAVLPSFDRAVGAQFLQDSIPLWARFFAPGGQSAEAFTANLQKLSAAGNGAKAP